MEQNCWLLRSSPAVVEYIRRVYLLNIFCSLIVSTGASLDLASIEDTSSAKSDRVSVSNIMKGIAKKVEVADAELMANAQI